MTFQLPSITGQEQYIIMMIVFFTQHISLLLETISLMMFIRVFVGPPSCGWGSRGARMDLIDSKWRP